MSNRLSSETAVDAVRQVRSLKALDLAAQGWTYKAIADALGVSTQTARGDIMDTLDLVTEERRRLGKQFIDIQLGFLYKALSIALNDMATGVWQQGRTVTAITDQINKLLDLYPRDGMAGSGLSQTLQLSFSSTNITQQNNQTTLQSGSVPETNPLDKIRELVNQAKQMADAVNAVSPDQPDFASDDDLEINESDPMIIRSPSASDHD